MAPPAEVPPYVPIKLLAITSPDVNRDDRDDAAAFVDRRGGAPIEADEVALPEIIERDARATLGVAFEATEITPKSAVHANKKCGGIKVKVTDRVAFEPIRTGLRIAAALHELHSEWDFEGLDKMLKHKPAMEALRAGKSITEVEAMWADDLAAFKKKREAFLLYR